MDHFSLGGEPPWVARKTHHRTAPRKLILAAAIGAAMGAVATSLPAAEPRLPAPATSTAAAPVTIADVVAMHQSGLDDQVLLNAIRQNGMASPLATAELISLRRLGVSNAVISAMQVAAPQPATSSATVVTPAPPAVVHVYERPRPPVVIRTYADPWDPWCWHHPRPHYHARVHLGHGHGRKHRGGTSFGFGVTWR